MTCLIDKKERQKEEEEDEEEKEKGNNLWTQLCFWTTILYIITQNQFKILYKVLYSLVMVVTLSRQHRVIVRRTGINAIQQFHNLFHTEIVKTLSSLLFDTFS